MSFKAKDLQFDSEQPAFLRRLRGELTSGDSARHEQPIPRNKRMKKDDDEDDAPTYVLEDTKESLTKEEYEAFVSGKDPKDTDEAATGAKSDQDAAMNAPTQKDKIAEVGAVTKKRKAVKIVNEEPEDEKNSDPKNVDAKSKKKPKKKAKTVKLTFGDDDG
ncbi:hypothetical protein HBI56_081720 [Parastagonospora nodorum]|uniref:DUF4604 domain-containing protein n=2 Tax=Phaeosphaeria nodorum (strain SN15 / ATCC MYA-4574 / FGSC 10173) TaxID=321614 RepID=A0A7U2FG94_PHANO|nr:hypothetical protein HBH56_104830 [Parastagonospora nodorum]QRD04712.1 hypothetical protein JI435_106480 [Parastagonospora nodorum SN15]KAH3929363.1 hypothetical protein HBH54_125580 [Parastagonospora nodorum]KAH3951683.1 hypothetical protein HBH53_059580 [Parastagonospora nodorum]KAH3975326.1 hypothetical protein HBH52_127280 [Parastagonospora nodorum]